MRAHCVGVLIGLNKVHYTSTRAGVTTFVRHSTAGSGCSRSQHAMGAHHSLRMPIAPYLHRGRTPPTLGAVRPVLALLVWWGMECPAAA